MTYKSQIRFEDTYLGHGKLHTVKGHCDLDRWPQFLKNRIHNISPTLFEEQFQCSCVDAS